MSEDKELGKKVLSGSMWIIALEFSNQILQFLKTFYAAKILTPRDFGIIGFAFLIIAFIDIISTTGMKEAVIQRKDNVSSYLDTVWLIEIGKGLVVLLIALVVAPFAADLANSDNPELTRRVIQIVGCIYFVQCATSIGVVFFEKQIQFSKYFLYQFSGTLTDVVVSVSLIYYLENVWGLFYGILAGNIVRVIFSYILSSYRPRFHFSLSHARELLNYGKWIFIGRVYNFLGLQADSIIVTSFFNLHSLGIYQMAVRIGNLPMNQVSNIIGRLAFPTFSKVQEDLDQLRNYFLLALNVLAVAMIPLVLLVLCFIGEFTTLFLGDKWLAIVPVVQVLIISGLLRIFVSIVDSYFCAIGKPRYSSRLQLTRFIVFVVMTAGFSYFFGILGAALGGLVSLAVVLFIFLRLACVQLNIRAIEIHTNILMPMAFGGVILAITYCIKHLFYQETILSFCILLVASAITYLGAGLLLGKLTPIKLFEKPIRLLQSYKNGH